MLIVVPYSGVVYVYSLVSSHRHVYFFFLMIRRPPRSTLDRSSAASDVYKRQAECRRAREFLINVNRIVVARHTGEHYDVGLGDRPVSYTHLRAHETVLDLVCRLLLEKKKQEHRRRLRESEKKLTLNIENMAREKEYKRDLTMVR